MKGFYEELSHEIIGWNVSTKLSPSRCCNKMCCSSGCCGCCVCGKSFAFPGRELRANGVPEIPCPEHPFYKVSKCKSLIPASNVTSQFAVWRKLQRKKIERGRKQWPVVGAWHVWSSQQWGWWKNGTGSPMLRNQGCIAWTHFLGNGWQGDCPFVCNPWMCAAILRPRCATKNCCWISSLRTMGTLLRWRFLLGRVH